MSNSIGNLKNSGLQGNNFPWQLKMLQGQQCACDYLKEIDLNTDQVEPLLVQILAAIQQGSDFEAFLVVDGNDVTWLEVRIWNPATGTFDPPIYFAVGSNVPGTPAPPISYINPNTYLAQIVSYTSNLISIEAGTPDALGQTTMAASMPVVIASNQTGIPVTDNGGSLTVDGTVSLSTATLTALENITVQNGAGAAAVNIQDGGNSITVDAIDLDIRNLTFATDSVNVSGSNVLVTNAVAVSGISDGTDSLQINTDGSINVNATIDCTTSSIAICDGTPGGSNLVINNPGSPADGSINTVLVDLTTGSPAVINPDGTQNNAIYGYDYSTLQNEAITSTDISPTVQALDVNLTNPSLTVQITPNIQVSINDIATIINPVYSISFANIGTADALVSFDSGTTQVSIPPGVTINMDAGGLGNFYASSTFAWDTQSNLGSKLVITYNT
jgi:hypothetical protein